MEILLTPKKLSTLLQLAETVRTLAGCIVELGVYQGGALKALAGDFPEKRCYGFDTFAGMPKESWREIDFHKPGEFGNTTLATEIAITSSMQVAVFVTPAVCLLSWIAVEAVTTLL